MGIIINEEYTGRELEIDLEATPQEYYNTLGYIPEEVGDDIGKLDEIFADYKGPLGSIFYQEEGGWVGTPVAYLHFKDLDKGVREELIKVEHMARDPYVERDKLFNRVGELLGPQLAASTSQQ